MLTLAPDQITSNHREHVVTYGTGDLRWHSQQPQGLPEGDMHYHCQHNGGDRAGPAALEQGLQPYPTIRVCGRASYPKAPSLDEVLWTPTRAMPDCSAFCKASCRARCMASMPSC